MSLTNACTEVGAVINRARSLFATSPEPPIAAGAAAAALRRAAEGSVGARSQMSTLSGDLIDQHAAFVARSAPALTASAQADVAVGSQLQNAALLTRSGASQLDALAAENRATTAAAAGARSPAAQRAVLTALKGQVSRAQAIVGSAQQAATQLAAGIRTARYRAPTGGPGPDDQIVDADAKKRGGIQLVDNRTGPAPAAPPQPGQPFAPGDPFVGDPRFGQWENVPPPPPYVGTPPPLKPETRRFPDDTPLKVGPTTGMYTPGKTWIGDIDPPMVKGEEEYRFRMSGQQATTITRMVNDNGGWHQQRWVQNLYEYQRNTSYSVSGDIGLRGIDGQGGDFGGLPPIQTIDHDWKPISLPQIAVLSANNAGTTYYLPDGCGGTIKFDGGVSIDPGAPPSIPVMRRPR
ncbi:hypothetical protein ACQ86B_28990 (plasmid) [Mycolicibacterium aichiense]|uniref:hypothetical protein n=1 Tax=Mycolicibacterium aichiense TaxID=1799 RepID=UPI003D66EFAA